METIQLVSVFDTTITDNNLGNEIIMDAVYGILRDIFPFCFFIKVPYLESIGPQGLKYLASSDYIFFGGTNSLSSDMKQYRQWGVDESNIDLLKNVVMMGIGWWQYQGKPTSYTRTLLGKVLHKECIHSARDSYTAQMMWDAGIENVVVTGCPTLWKIDNIHCATIPIEKSDEVLLTVTNYCQNPNLDSRFVSLLEKHYAKLHCWIQGPEDYEYARKLNPDINFIPPSIKSLDSFLSSSKSLDYVGTRLHAGIRALQHRRRSIIIGVDNRALEMAKDFNLPVVNREEINAIEERITGSWSTDIKLPHDEIKKWSNQFSNLLRNPVTPPDPSLLKKIFGRSLRKFITRS